MRPVMQSVTIVALITAACPTTNEAAEASALADYAALVTDLPGPPLQNEEALDHLPLASAISVIDIFDRNVTAELTLVDWEGPVRNPAMKYFLKGDENLDYPLALSLSSDQELASFSLPSTVSKNGPTKSMLLNSMDDLESFLFSVFMDEDYEDELFDLEIRYSIDGILSRQIIPLRVLDQDLDRPLTYPVIVDFSEARAPLMLDESTQDVIRQAAEDWAYFVDGEGIDVIPAGGSFLDIGGTDHLFEEKMATNSVEYKGFYLFAYGNTNAGPCVCSSGFPNRDLLQSKNGVEVPIFRIGGLHLNLLGQAFETPPTGWEALSSFENWSQQDLIGTDMYTLAQHEIGHAMVFENSPLFLEAQERLGFTSPALTACYPAKVVPLFPHSLSHVIEVLDPASQVVPYGGGDVNEIMPEGRSLVTKLDILIMESVGFPIRDNAVTRNLSLIQETTLNGEVAQSFEGQLVAQGGIPVYSFDIQEGDLPPGLILNVFSGEITGTPDSSGQYAVTFLVRDYDEHGSSASLETVISIAAEGAAEGGPIAVINGVMSIHEDSDGLPGEYITIDLSNSTDADGTIDSISITIDGEVVGTEESISILLADGDHVIEVTVTDNDGKTGTTQYSMHIVERFYNGIKPKGGLNIEYNNIANLDLQSLSIYTCVQIYSEG